MLEQDHVICTQQQKKPKTFFIHHDTMKLLSSFLGDFSSINDSLEVKPSIYLREMMMSTDQRIEQLNKSVRRRYSCSSPSKKISKDFKITPPAIIFQSFLPGKQYSATLSLCNISEGSKQLAVKSEPSEVFSVNYLSKVCSKLAPGMTLHFQVKFSSHLDQDSSHCLTIETENSSFDVPFIGLGSRPLVNFPDIVNLEETLVRTPRSKSFYVKNIGLIPATFNMVCEKPFLVNPERCLLDVGNIAVITIVFEPETVNDFFKQMSIRFETGEKLTMELTGSSKNGKIWLDGSRVNLDDTFMGLKCQHKVTLYNDSEAVVKFSWHKFETIQEELDELERMKERFKTLTVDETIRCNKLEYHEVINEDDHSKVYSRIFADETLLLSPNDFTFSNKNFDITPMEGEVWPGGRCNVTVTFSPDTTGQFSCRAFCDVTGRDNKLALHLSGQGLGPVIKLSLRSLDIGNVFLGSNQAYEVIAANKGDIPGRIQYIPKAMFFGGVLICEPEAHCLMASEMKSFIISFSSSRTGKFVEELVFQIEQSGEELNLSLKGSVINPTISFDSMKLDFGCVPVGFPVTQCVNLLNKSHVPVAFALRVPSDGQAKPTSYDVFSAASEKPALSTYCNEFTISPDTGVIEANSSLTVQVTLLTNIIQKSCCTLVAENKNSKLSESLSLSIYYDSQVGQVLCSPSEMILRFCFINYEYKQEFVLTNVSNIPTYFYIPPQKNFPQLSLAYKTDIIEKLLEPGESVQVAATITPLVVGRVAQDIMVLMFGRKSLLSLCTISCCAQGPNVSTSLEGLNFGQMTLMESKTLSLELSNDSPIGAAFLIYVEEKLQTKWELEPNRGYLQPGDVVTVNVTLTVVDPGNILSTMLVQVENSRPITIELFASASGCGIIFDPNIFPQINLGYLFSRRLYQFTLKLFNPGSRHHLIQFISEKISIKPGCSSLNLFKFIPHKFELSGGEKTQVILEGQSNRELEVCEGFVCWAVINKRGIKQNLGNILVKANFIAPMVELSEDLLEFEINIDPGDSQGQINTKTLKFKSVANLPVTMVLELNSPFVILEDEDARFSETLVSLGPEEEAEVRVGFLPPIQNNLQSTVYSGILHISYQEHPQKDKIHLRGKLNFPNMQFSQHVLDFGCIPLDFHDSKGIIMVNPTPLPVTYSFAWDPESIVTTYFEQERMEDILGADLPSYLKLDPLYHNRLIPSLEDKESMMGPLPLIYVEPVPVNPSKFDKGHEDEVAGDREEEGQIHDTLFPVIEPYFSPEHPTPEFNILPNESYPVPVVSKVFDLTPTFGTLEPFQSQVLNVSFQPKALMGMAVTAVCTVVGGPTETLRLSGQSARHIFSLSTTFINFGFRTFMEPCEEVIRITNMSHLPFRFKIFSSSTPLPVLEFEDIEVGKITVEPSFGEVASQSTSLICVKFYPGLSGEFQEQFSIQIGYLEPVKVLVTGYGVLPQISINQLHISRPRIPVGWMYTAVATLTAKRFRHFISCHHTPEIALTDDILQDWVIISYTDKFPTNDDIWLAIERIIALNFVKDNPLCLTQGCKGNFRTIPQLLLPGYVLDFGSVVVGTTTEATVMVENRGLVRSDVNLGLTIPEKKLKQDGFYINFQNHIGLPVGRTVPLSITIKPTFQRYFNKEELVHFTLNFQVANGATLPIYARALLTVPHIVVDQKTIDFDFVECGQCAKMCLLLKNSGVVEAEWTATLVHTKRRKCQGKEFLEQQEIPFFLNKTNALFPPKTAELLEIGFLPKSELHRTGSEPEERQQSFEVISAFFKT